MYFGEMAAIGAALCWSFAGLISVGPSRAIGPIAFNRLRMGITSLILLAIAFYTGGIYTLRWESSTYLVISSIFGIFLGDTILFVTINRLGPRRSGILFASNAPITALLGYVFLSESLSLFAIAGCAITIIGVMVAVYFRRDAGTTHSLERIQGSLSIGVAYGFLAAVLQAVGSIIAKPALEEGVDPLAAAALRTSVAALLLLCTLFCKKDIFHAKKKIDLRIIFRTAMSGFVGMALGMTFLLYGFANSQVGIVATLSSIAPVLTLPLIWILTKQRPHIGAWCGAIFTVFGAVLIFLVD